MEGLDINTQELGEESVGGRSSSLIVATFFLLLSMAWTLDQDGKKSCDKNVAGQSYLRRLQIYLPVFGLYLVTVSSLCIILSTLQLSGDQRKDYATITLLAAFSLCGLFNIALFYIKTVALMFPKNISKLGVVLCFLLELFLLQRDHCLLSIIVCCLVVSVLKMVHTTTILTFSLVIFTMVQGTWLLHSSFLPTSHSMTNIYFSWHLLAVFIITTTLNIISNISVKRNSQKRKLSEEAQQKTSNLTDTVKKTILTFDELNVDILQKEKLNLVTEQPKSREDLEIMNVLNSIDKMVSNQGRAENCKDNEEKPLKERISPLEEFNALFRNVEGVRKSIKLKDSGIV